MRRSLFELEVEQITLPVKRLRQSEKATIETSMAEMSGANLALPIDGVVTTTAAGSSVRQMDRWLRWAAALPSLKAWGFEGLLGVQQYDQLAGACLFLQGDRRA